ncbi:MAG TPA: hypothetical protein VJ829_13340, partial [Candidatus Binatia bacterium]|nr:hypothetical protein [Candidatus Binatia bacterium]
MPRAVTLPPRGREVPLVLLWTAAALYFVLGITRTLEGTDEGHLVYMSWRVSQGALPYRDFHH